MKKIILIFFFALGVFMAWYYWRHPLGAKAIINDRTIQLEIALTPAEKEKGLGYRDSLAENAGMLFVYQNRDRYGFWMKGMRFPLDVIWIEGNTIVDLTENVAINATAFAPRVPVDKVLEVNAGLIKSLGIHVGDPVRFTN